MAASYAPRGTSPAACGLRHAGCARFAAPPVTRSAPWSTERLHAVAPTATGPAVPPPRPGTFRGSHALRRAHRPRGSLHFQPQAPNLAYIGTALNALLYAWHERRMDRLSGKEWQLALIFSGNHPAAGGWYDNLGTVNEPIRYESPNANRKPHSRQR